MQIPSSKKSPLVVGIEHRIDLKPLTEDWSTSPTSTEPRSPMMSLSTWRASPTNVSCVAPVCPSVP